MKKLIPALATAAFSVVLTSPAYAGGIIITFWW